MGVQRLTVDHLSQGLGCGTKILILDPEIFDNSGTTVHLSGGSQTLQQTGVGLLISQFDTLPDFKKKTLAEGKMENTHVKPARRLSS